MRQHLGHGDTGLYLDTGLYVDIASSAAQGATGPVVPSPGELPWGPCFAHHVGTLLSVPIARLCQEP